MREIETYLNRAEEALQLLALADGPEAKSAILEILRTWIGVAEARAVRRGIRAPELMARVQGLNDNLARVGADAE